MQLDRSMLAIPRGLKNKAPPFKACPSENTVFIISNRFVWINTCPPITEVSEIVYISPIKLVSAIIVKLDFKDREPFWT